ncbi:two-component system sensor histidine kinase AtoS [Metabacillus crassostreae]|uniref:sensor histidine kinase n=1 Tax=Metabacillus crassostreae TaxID=929098 RepID=UPI001959A9F6|nr:sensor histidine kinase [Metabacillus crassostreae]MBM7604934.1 two-component system sensor histidine kinase AtoS [Metabacillus crassostreae]
MKKLLKTMSFRTKILTILLILTIILSGFSLILVQSIEEITQVSNKIKRTNIPELYLLNQWEKELGVKEYIVNDYLENNLCCNLVEEYQAYTLDMEENMKDSDTIPDSLSNIKKRIDLLDFMIINNIQGLIAFDDKPATREYFHSTFLPQLNELKQDIKTSKKQTISQFDGHSNQFSTIIKSSLWLLILVTAGAILMSIIVSYRISSSLTKPIETVVNKVDKIANGEYGLTIDSTEQTEFNHLTNSINQMSVKLRESFNTIVNDKVYREQILNSLPVGIIRITDDPQEMTSNSTAANILNMDNKEIDNKCLENIEELNEEFWKILSTKAITSHTKVLFVTEQGAKHLLVSQAELKNQQQQVIGRIVNFVDITETEVLENRMHKSEKLAVVGEIAAGAAHEIRNPLAVIHGFLSLMEQSISNENKEQFHIPLLMKEVERINTIIEEMLLLSKPGAPNKKEVFLEDVLKDFLPLIIEATENVNFSIDLNRMPLNIDAKQIKQVFHNLIRNSIEAMDGKGNLSIFSVVQNNFYHIFIKDSGQGIPKHIIDNLYEPFTSNKENGTGLGLMVVKRVIENHNGHIELHETSTEGTTFLISLPLK